MQARRQMRRLSKYLHRQSLDRGQEALTDEVLTRGRLALQEEPPRLEDRAWAYNKAVAKFCKDSDEGLAQSIPEGQTKGS